MDVQQTLAEHVNELMRAPGGQRYCCCSKMRTQRPVEAATRNDSGLQKSHFLSSGERTRLTRKLKKDRGELEAVDFAGNISRESVVDGVKRCPGVSAVKQKKKGCEN